MTSPATAAAPTDAWRLYFAVYPDAATAAAIAALAEATRVRWGLRGRAVPERAARDLEAHAVDWPGEWPEPPAKSGLLK